MAWEDVMHGRREVTLLGDFHCMLTIEEQNEWHEHFGATPEWIAFRDAENHRNALLVACGADASLRVELEASLSRARDLQDALYPVAKAWYAGLVERRREASGGI